MGDRVMMEADRVSKRYRGPGKRQVDAVSCLSLWIREGECRGIVGESGCGKSTLIRMLAGLERPGAGQILYKGEPVEQRMKKHRNEIQMIFQNSMDAVNQYATAEDIIGEPLRNFTSMRRMERRERCACLMEQVGLPAADLIKYPRQFSGGQLQRVCIARALAAKPEILLLDEPLSSLDVSVQAQIMKLLETLGRENRLTQVLVSHDLEAVYYLSDSLSVMYGGYMVEDRWIFFPGFAIPIQGGYSGRVKAWIPGTGRRIRGIVELKKPVPMQGSARTAVIYAKGKCRR